MKITTDILKLAKNNNANLECLRWLIDNINNNITRENIIPEHYIWLIAIGFPPSSNLINFCITKNSEGVMKYGSHLLNREHIEYCIKLNPNGAIKYLDHRMTTKDTDTCTLLCQNKSISSKKSTYVKDEPAKIIY